MNCVSALRPSGMLIKDLDTFIDKLLISILQSLGKTDNFIFLSGRERKMGGAFRSLIDQTVATRVLFLEIKETFLCTIQRSFRKQTQ